MRHHFYLAGPMRGYPDFNFPAFYEAEDFLLSQGHTVFNPARRDEREYGAALADNPTGDVDKAAKEHGFDLREALAADTQHICLTATAMYMLRGWHLSKGAIAERALAQALGIPVAYEAVDGPYQRTASEEEAYQEGRDDEFLRHLPEHESYDEQEELPYA